MYAANAEQELSLEVLLSDSISAAFWVEGPKGEKIEIYVEDSYV